jgi:hypothetical protein
MAALLSFPEDRAVKGILLLAAIPPRYGANGVRLTM